MSNDSDLSQKYCSRAHAESLDEQDTLKHLRREFIIPTKNDLKSRTLAKSCKFHFRLRPSSYPVLPQWTIGSISILADCK